MSYLPHSPPPHHDRSDSESTSEAPFGWELVSGNLFDSGAPLCGSECTFRKFKPGFKFEEFVDIVDGT